MGKISFLIDDFASKMAKFSYKLTSNIYLSILKNSFFTLMPVFIVAPIFVFINNVILNFDTGLIGFLPIPQSDGIIRVLDNIKNIGVYISNGTLGLATVFLVFLIGYKYNEKVMKNAKQSLISGITSVASYFVFIPTTVTQMFGGNEEIVSGVIGTVNLGTGSIFVGVVIGFLSSWLFTKMIKSKKLSIKMPDGVPPAVVRSFESVFPFLLTILPMAIGAVVLDAAFHVTINDIVATILSKPLTAIVGSLPGFLLIYAIMQSGAFLGIHMSWLQSITLMPIQLLFLQENLNLIDSGKEATHILTTSFMNSFGMIGGGGHVLAVIIAIFIFSRRKNHRAIAKIGTPMSLFNISEPVWLGLPLAFNPIMAIPYILAPILTLTLSYFATTIGIIPILAYDIPWTTPVFFQSFFASGGNILAGLWALLMLGLTVLIYAPFVKAMVKSEELEEQANTNSDAIEN